MPNEDAAACVHGMTVPHVDDDFLSGARVECPGPVGHFAAVYITQGRAPSELIYRVRNDRVDEFIQRWTLENPEVHIIRMGSMPLIDYDPEATEIPTRYPAVSGG